MKPEISKTTTPISKLSKAKLLNAGLFILILLVTIIGIIFSQKLSKEIQTKKQQTASQQQALQSSQSQLEFFESNPEIIQTISSVLPNQDSIINVVDDVESLQTKLEIPIAFEFASIVPTKDTTNSYVSFVIKTNTTTLKSLSFLRSFEKLPYLTKITSISMKTPQGIGGPIELSISGRIYVQNPF